MTKVKPTQKSSVPNVRPDLRSVPTVADGRYKEPSYITRRAVVGLAAIAVAGLGVVGLNHAKQWLADSVNDRPVRSENPAVEACQDPSQYNGASEAGISAAIQQCVDAAMQPSESVTNGGREIDDD